MNITVDDMEKIYKREDYLKKIRDFYKDDMIKVITGIRRSGKSYLLKSIIEELLQSGIKQKDIIYIKLDKKEYKDIKTFKELEKIIDEKILYTSSVINQIFEEDIKTSNKIKDKALFERIEKYIINNFGAVTSIKNIHNYLTEEAKIKADRRTIKRYLDILEKAKIIYPCDLFDIKSKSVLKGEKKYYLADLSIYYSMNTDNRINYGPVLENIMYQYLKSKNYQLSVGKIGKLECDFIARKNYDSYYYIQISKDISNKDTEEREYRPFCMIKELYPRYLFTMDLLLQKRDGIIHENIVDFIYHNKNL